MSSMQYQHKRKSNVEGILKGAWRSEVKVRFPTMAAWNATIMLVGQVNGNGRWQRTTLASSRKGWHMGK